MTEDSFIGGMRYPGDRVLVNAHATPPLARLTVGPGSIRVGLRWGWLKALALGVLPDLEIPFGEITSIERVDGGIATLWYSGVRIWWGAEWKSVLFWCTRARRQRLLARLQQDGVEVG